MQVKIKYLAEKFGFCWNTIATIIDRAEFAKYRTGGTGGLFFELNNESSKLLRNILKTKRGRR